MTWNEYIDKIKDGPIPVASNPPKKEDCDANGKFLAYFHKEKNPVWGYLSINYIEKNDPMLYITGPQEGEGGYYPLYMLCSHWLPCPPILDSK